VRRKEFEQQSWIPVLRQRIEELTRPLAELQRRLMQIPGEQQADFRVAAVKTTKGTDSGAWVLGMGHGAGRGLLRGLGRCGTVLSAAEKRLTKL
jgi:hypothetical protein